MLIDDESVRLTVYDDATGLPITPGTLVKGHPTIGVGRCLDTNGISKTEAMRMLDQDIARAERQADGFQWFHDLDWVRQDVIVMMLFNLGLTKFLKFKRMIKAVEEEDYEGAAFEMVNSTWREQVGTRALTLSEMMKKGRYPKESTA